MVQHYKIAGLTVQMDTFGRLEKQARPYLCPVSGAPDMVVDSNTAEAATLRLSADDREYSETGRSFYTQLMGFQGMMLHASAVVVDGRAYLFSANSGTGKSTHVNLWLHHFGDRAVLLNDDKPALRLEDGAWYAYGTPWSGKHDLSANLRVPVAGIAMVNRSETNFVERFSGTEAVRAILEQTLRPNSMTERITLLGLMDSLMRNVPVWKVHCNMEPEAAVVSYEAMSGVKKEI